MSKYSARYLSCCPSNVEEASFVDSPTGDISEKRKLLSQKHHAAHYTGLFL